MYCSWRIPAHLRCTQCSILLHLMDIFFLACICLKLISQIQTRLIDVVEPGLVSTSPGCVRSSAIHPADPHGRLAQKTVNRDPHFRRREGSTQFAQQFVTAVTAPPIVGCVVWLCLASSTSINTLKVMQNAALSTATGCTQTYNTCMTKHSKHYSSTPHNTNRQHTIHHTPDTNIDILQHFKAKKILSSTMAASQKTSHRPHTVTTIDIIKTNMSHIHISIVSMHLASRDNNKILRTPLTHISCSEEILRRLTRPKKR